MSQPNNISRRDYFAAKAMQAFITIGDGEVSQKDICSFSALYADALIAELDKNVIKCPHRLGTIWNAQYDHNVCSQCGEVLK